MTSSITRKSIGIITIATGKYFSEFIPNLHESIKQYLEYPEYKINFYCLTDQQCNDQTIKIISIPHLSWPFSTLLRYHWIFKNIKEFTTNDFLIYMDADMKVISKIPASIYSKELIAVRHPGYLNSKGLFEIDRISSVYIHPQQRKIYYQGCFWGGQKDIFISFISKLNDLVNNDLLNFSIPVWHDESYLNYFLCSKNNVYALPETFAFPEYKNIENRKPYILHLEKKHKEIRQANDNALDVIETLTGDNQLKKMTLYQNLYLSSHEKCQRLEEKIIQRGSWIFRLREWLSFYKK